MVGEGPVTFEYSLYYDACFVMPLLILIAAVCAIIYATGILIKHTSKKEFRLEILLKVIVFYLVGSFFVCLNGGRLLNGGIMLISEKESSAVTIEGTITAVEDLGKFSFPELKTEYGYSRSNGVLITVGGKRCKASTLGQFEIGDSVSVFYLPKSGYILSITETDQ